MAQPSPIIRSILVANRGEIAQRIQATAHARGINTVAVFAPQDINSDFVYQATQAYALSGDGAAAYLDQEQIITIAQKANANTIHPGYGFLSERADFAKKVQAAGLIWLGPEPQTIAAMGDKAAACALMRAHGVPTIPGSTIDAKDQEQALKLIQDFAQAHGYPILLKDPLGGGGKGIWIITSAEQASTIVPRACVMVSQGRPVATQRLVVEQYLAGARHIEVQIAGDGNEVIHLFERECSLQRRHQKIIEEAPAIFVTPQTRTKIHQAALQAARAVRYSSIGTVEFLALPDGRFYFLEMNTRLQVEHSVTEMTTGIDLIGLQLDIAIMGVLPAYACNTTQQGHAVQCRIYAEDPAQKFLPSTGTITSVTLPRMPWLRVDCDLAPGTAVTGAFDPMIAKLTSWDHDRPTALNRMSAALNATKIGGIATNISFLIKLLNHPVVAQGHAHTQTLADQDLVQELATTTTTQTLIDTAVLELVAATAALYAREHKNNSTPDQNDAHAWRSQQWR